MHGGSIPEKMKHNPIKYLNTLRRADIVVCPSRFFMETLSAYYIKGILIENVISLSHYHFHCKETFRPRIFWMRTLEDIYNPEMAVRVGAILAKKYPDFKMVMAGYDRGSLEIVKKLARKLGIFIKSNFRVILITDRKEPYAAEFDIYICTNRIDNAPVLLLK